MLFYIYTYTVIYMSVHIMLFIFYLFFMEVSLFFSDLRDQPGWTVKRLIDTHHSFSVHSRKTLGTPVHKGKGPDHTLTRGWTVG